MFHMKTELEVNKEEYKTLTFIPPSSSTRAAQAKMAGRLWGHIMNFIMIFLPTPIWVAVSFKFWDTFAWGQL